MKMVVVLLALTALAHAEPDKPDVIRWDAFPGPETAAPTSSEVFAVCPATAGIWGRNVDFVVAQVETTTPKTVTIRVLKDHYEVPAVFASPVTRIALSSSKAAVGGYVRFQAHPSSMPEPMHVGRVSAVDEHGYTIEYAISGGSLTAHDVSPLEVIPLDGKLRFGGAVSFDRDHHRAFGWYVGPGNARDTSWVVSDTLLQQKKGIKPLTIARLAKGEKVVAAFDAESLLDDPYQPLRKGTIIAVSESTLAVRVDEGPFKGKVYRLEPEVVFAR